MQPWSTRLNQGFTTITLALFDDSGWYAVDYSKADGSRKGTTFGYKQGCGFARDFKCLRSIGGALVPSGVPPHYSAVTRLTAYGQCRLDRLGYGGTGVYIWSAALPPQYRYFANPLWGGRFTQADFCPVELPQTGFPFNPQGLCSTPLSALTMSAVDKDRGMVYGTGSVCLDTSLSVGGVDEVVAGCYRWTCTSVASATVTTAGGTKTCTAAGQRLTFPGYQGAVICPDPSSLCAIRSLALQDDIVMMNLSAVLAEQSLALQPSVDPAPQEKVSGFSGGQTAGIAAGGVAVGAAIVAAVGASVFAVKRRRRVSAPAAVSTTTTSLPPSVEMTAVPSNANVVPDGSNSAALAQVTTTD
jgi:Leishmanolysin